MKETLTLVGYILAAIFATIAIISVFRKLSITIDEPESSKNASRKRNSTSITKKKQVSFITSNETNKGNIDPYELNSLRNDVIELKRKVLDLDRNFHKLDERLTINKQAQIGHHITGYSKEIYKKTDIASRSETVFYMSEPTGNGFKDNLKRKVFEQGMTMYRFEHKDSISAYFDFYGDDVSTKDALSMPTKYVEPVCDELNKVTASSKKVVTKEKGFVILNGEIWEIKNKAKIRYE